ncbi:hypothetical protein [Caulobacter hibisci]|uniref:Calcium-binding protein n=1 Tax=Caulobacter hibisci TaxID=2035993 RepID=A0ABS0T570_9CAUL|nr:hypothetical protein [Caulobacter hibisci]MBI1687019.1 hypothetical protein [Caulobacter hibisci]
MALGDNSKLITTADTVSVSGNGTNDPIANTGGATAFSFTGGSGDDQLEGFGKNDSVLNYQKIFDGNGDGIIDFGPNGILDISRTTAKNAGADQITLQGMESKQLRYLGSKEGYFVYADASVRLKGFTEGTVNNDTFDAGTGAKKYFYDTALGLNLGGDTITNFGADDRIVTTTKLHNGTDAGALITYGKNEVLDLSGETNGIKGDVGPTHGGQIDIVGTNHLALLDIAEVNGVTYYYYGLEV